MRVFFLHIPKTAGITLLSLLSRRFKLEETLWGDWPVITPKVSENYSFIAGHLYLCQVCLAQLRNHYKVTILRNPVDRAISHYYHLNESVCSGRGLPEPIQAALDEGLEQSILSGSFRHTLDTAMRHLSSLDAGVSGAENLGSAKTNLCYFDAVGFLDENYEDFMRALCQRIGIDLEAVPHENKSPWKPCKIELSDEAYTLLRSYLVEDYQLYDYAREKFGKFLVK